MASSSLHHGYNISLVQVLSVAVLAVLSCSASIASAQIVDTMPSILKRTEATVQSNGSITHGSNSTIILRGSASPLDVVILDYGANIEGHPQFEVVSATGDTSRLEITYSESKAVLDGFYMSDGPNGLAAAMDTYRVNQYNITSPGPHQNRLIQGGFRYQKFNLSSLGELVLTKVGVKATTSTTPLTQLPGLFESSVEELNRIWSVGARTIQLNSIDHDTIPPFWQVSSEGSLVESQAPQVLFGSVAAALMQYKIAFEVKPLTKGFGFSVLADTLGSGIYVFCNVANRSISAHFGHTEWDSPPLAFAILPETVSLGNWNTVTAQVAITEVDVSINGVQVLKLSQSSSFFGSFGLGASLGHSAIFRNLSASTLTGEPIYSSSLTDESFFDDFMLGTNPLDIIVDGSKRDRIAYAGDLDIALVSALASTNGTSYIHGTLDLLGSYQLTPGFFSPTAKIQQHPLSTPIDANRTGLIGYSFNLLTAVAQFYHRTGDTQLAQEWAPKVVRMLDWAHASSESNGLFNISDPALGGDWNYYDPPQVGVVSKFNMVYAYALQECLSLLDAGGIDSALYATRLEDLKKAINAGLWSSKLGAFSVSESVKDVFAQDSNALAILAGVTNSTQQSAQILNTLKQLQTPHGPLAFSSGAQGAGFAKLISPYVSAYHLRAALSVADSDVALELLKSLWLPMADPNGANYTGCFWETLDANGAPGLGRSTSLCHAWGAGPTAELSEYVLGVKPVTPGYSEWVVSPVTLGLEWARGRVPIPRGDITVAWNASTESIVTRVEVRSPPGTFGKVVLPKHEGDVGAGLVWKINGEVVEYGNGTFPVVGGRPFLLTSGKINACKVSQRRILV